VVSGGLDPVRLSLFGHLFASLCEEMGATLRRTAFSPNIKERQDYSCALFDGRGGLLAQGEHLPVHLGSLPASVAAALRSRRLEPGDLVLLNDPFRGGTHLPDLTLVAPWFDPGGEGEGPAPLFHLACRAHHADVGGSEPGSMPLATEIHQEGLVIPPLLVARRGELDEDLLGLILANVRTPEERRGDLLAQAAALATGGRRLEEAVRRHGVRALAEAGEALTGYSERMMRAVIRDLPDGVYRAEDRLDDDGVGEGPVRLEVELAVRGEEARVDLRRVPEQVRGSVNAVRAITVSAVAYCFRCLAPEDLPGNEGCFRPLEVLTRPGSVLDARPPAAVAGGNVETSQRVVDLVFRALALALPERIPAASQGTMNNLTLGGVDPRTGGAFAYYETIGGGAGAGPAGPGRSGVHSHMTNSLNTPVEALEHAYPLRVRALSLRRGSGGGGRHRGGEGIRRSVETLVPVRLSLLTERRVARPWGLAGGEDGAPGRNRLRLGGEEETLPAKVSRGLPAGAVVTVETPGGGGWGRGEVPPRARGGPEEDGG
jgi:N-methylhydantoinase B